MQFDQFASSRSRSAASYFLSDSAARYAAAALTLLRVMTALLFFEHGTSKLFGWPAPSAPPALFGVIWWAGALELVGGAMVAAGLFTRAAAFILSGEMAAAYFISHAPASVFPIVNRGDSAILYCLVFFYIAVAGAGPWSVDGWLRRNR